MKEYTLISLIVAVIVICLDKMLKTNVLARKEYYLFLAVTFCFKLAVNGILTYSQIVTYDPMYYLGIRLGSIPMEDFLFGFSMVTCGIISWEWFKRGD